MDLTDADICWELDPVEELPIDAATVDAYRVMVSVALESMGVLEREVKQARESISRLREELRAHRDRPS